MDNMTEISLKDYIAKTLDDITAGIDEARKKHFSVAPKKYDFPNNPREVHFDIAITIIDEKRSLEDEASKAGGGLKLAVFSGSADVSEKKEKAQNFNRSEQNRVQFSVPIYPELDHDKYLQKFSKPHSFKKTDNISGF